MEENESSKINPSIYSKLTFEKGVRNTQSRKKKESLINDAGLVGY